MGKPPSNSCYQDVCTFIACTGLGTALTRWR